MSIKTHQELIAYLREHGLSDRSIRRRAGISSRQFRLLTRKSADGTDPVAKAAADMALRAAQRNAR